MLGDGEILAPVYGLKEGGSELQMSGFEFMNMADYGLKDERLCNGQLKVIVTVVSWWLERLYVCYTCAI